MLFVHMYSKSQVFFQRNMIFCCKILSIEKKTQPQFLLYSLLSAICSTAAEVMYAFSLELTS